MTTPRFWREIPSRYNLIGSQCGNCGKDYFPPRLICPDCHRKSFRNMKEIKFDGEGEVISYSVVHNAPKAFEMQVPYVMAIIQFKEGIRVTGQIIDSKIEDVQIGMKVKSTFRKIGEDGSTGVIYYGYKFRPI
jgi:uncharacterized OB-fold protein